MVCAYIPNIDDLDRHLLYDYLAWHKERIRENWPEKGQTPIKALISALQGVKDDCEKEYLASGKMLEAIDMTAEIIELIES